MLEIASTEDRTTGDPWENKCVDKMKRWVREAKDFRKKFLYKFKSHGIRR
jgi:hypothetical protein